MLSRMWWDFRMNSATMEISMEGPQNQNPKLDLLTNLAASLTSSLFKVL